MDGLVVILAALGVIALLFALVCSVYPGLDRCA